MRGPKPDLLILSDAERTDLEELVRRHGTPQQLARRARIIRASAQGKNNCQIARELGICVDTVRMWRTRWIGLQAASLDDLPVKERLWDVPRPGRHARITAEQTCQMVAMACEQPKERPISHWTGREIADEVMRRGIVPQISPRHAARLLKKPIGSTAFDPLLVDPTGRSASGGNGESDLHVVSGRTWLGRAGRTDRHPR